jgi:hypothetical protein
MNSVDINIYGYAYFIKFLDYFKKYGILHKKFKMKDFICGDAYGCMGGHRPYADIDMTVGCIRYALAFGHQRGYIVDVSNSKRGFDLFKLKCDGIL